MNYMTTPVLLSFCRKKRYFCFLLLLVIGTLSLHAQQPEKDFAPGSQEDKDYHTANRRNEQMLDTLIDLVAFGQEYMNDVIVQLALSASFQKGEPIMKTDFPAFIRQHPASGANLRLLRESLRIKPVAGWMDTLYALYQSLPSSTKESAEGKELGVRLASELKTALGHKAMDFTQYDPEGHPVTLSSFKGKYVLLDFWASYDNNCAKALPFLDKAYENFGSKGLVILGVSLDSNKNAWLDMIRSSHSMMLAQVSDLKGKENAAARLYDVTTLPKNILIDPNGIIIAKDLTSLTMDQTLSSIFE